MCKWFSHLDPITAACQAHAFSGSAPSPLKEVLLFGLEVLNKPPSGVADPGITAQPLRFDAEPRLACMEVSEVAQRLLCRTQADIAGGRFRVYA